MGDIHDEANEIVEESDGANVIGDLFAQTLDEVQWVIDTSHHYVDHHDLSHAERVHLIETAFQATAQKIRLLEME